jgi:hypothetical protein
MKGLYFAEVFEGHIRTNFGPWIRRRRAARKVPT